MAPPSRARAFPTASPVPTLESARAATPMRPTATPSTVRRDDSLRRSTDAAPTMRGWQFTSRVEEATEVWRREEMKAKKCMASTTPVPRTPAIVLRSRGSAFLLSRRAKGASSRAAKSMRYPARTRGWESLHRTKMEAKETARMAMARAG